MLNTAAETATVPPRPWVKLFLEEDIAALPALVEEKLSKACLASNKIEILCFQVTLWICSCLLRYLLKVALRRYVIVTNNPSGPPNNGISVHSVLSLNTKVQCVIKTILKPGIVSRL